MRYDSRLVDVGALGDGLNRLKTGKATDQAPLYRTMPEIAFTYIRDAIMRGDLRPGDKIAQDAIASELGISRVPLREALRRLEERGFVVITPHKGARVALLSLREIKEIYFIRETLEVANARLAARNMDGQRIHRLRQILDQGRAAFDAGDNIQAAQANRDFHLKGHEASGNLQLNRLIAELSDHCQRYRLIHATLRSRARTAILEHKQILDAWGKKDEDGAAHWIQVNLANSRLALVEAIEQSEYGEAKSQSGGVSTEWGQ